MTMFFPVLLGTLSNLYSLDASLSYDFLNLLIPQFIKLFSLPSLITFIKKRKEFPQVIPTKRTGSENSFSLSKQQTMPPFSSFLVLPLQYCLLFLFPPNPQTEFSMLAERDRHKVAFDLGYCGRTLVGRGGGGGGVTYFEILNIIIMF